MSGKIPYSDTTRAPDAQFMENWLRVSHALEDEGVDMGLMMEAWVAELGLTLKDAEPEGAMAALPTAVTARALERAMRGFPAPSPRARRRLDGAADLVALASKLAGVNRG